MILAALITVYFAALVGVLIWDPKRIGRRRL